MALQRDQMRHYLLGTATETEAEEIEVRVIEGEGISNDLYVAESELIEDYLEGTLTDAEREMFEKHFLVSDARRDRVNEIRLLKRFSSGPHRFEIPEADLGRTSWSWRPWLVPVYGALILGIFGIAVWQFTGNESGSSLERQYAELNQKSFADPTEFREIKAVTVEPGVYRNAGVASSIELNGLGESVLFRLPLSFEVEPDAVFRAELIADGVPFAAGDVRAYRDGSVNEVRFLAPRLALRKGLNRIELTRKGNTDAPVVYVFEVR